MAEGAATLPPVMRRVREQFDSARLCALGVRRFSPLPNAHTGPGPVRALLQRHPALVLVLAHTGAPD